MKVRTRHLFSYLWQPPCRFFILNRENRDVKKSLKCNWGLFINSQNMIYDINQKGPQRQNEYFDWYWLSCKKALFQPKYEFDRLSETPLFIRLASVLKMTTIEEDIQSKNGDFKMTLFMDYPIHHLFSFAPKGRNLINHLYFCRKHCYLFRSARSC